MNTKMDIITGNHYGALVQIYPGQNLFHCSRCRNGGRYIGVPLPNVCSACGCIFTSVSLIRSENDEQEDHKATKEPDRPVKNWITRLLRR